MKNLLYRRTDEVEKLQKVIDDTNQQFVDCLQQIKTLGEEKTERQKELEDLKKAAQQLVDVVDPPEGGVADNRSLLERLRWAPQKITSFIAETGITYISHTLALLKSFWPQAKLEVLAEGATADCTEDNFSEYRQEVLPIAVRIRESLE